MPVSIWLGPVRTPTIRITFMSGGHHRTAIARPLASEIVAGVMASEVFMSEDDCPARPIDTD